MNMKFAVEEYLKASGMNYTVLRLCGFMQPLISGYAVPVLEEQLLNLHGHLHDLLLLPRGREGAAEHRDGHRGK